jgi:transglutaminase-like putative cysteine protease
MKRGLIGEIGNAILLAVVVGAPARAVAGVDLDRALPFGMVVWIAVAGIVVGMLLAYSGLPGSLAHLLATGVGVAGVFYAVARVIPNAPPEATLAERVGEVVYQISAWARVVFGGGQATNNLLFLLLLGLIAWIVGYFGAWSVFHERSAWWPVTISATALTLVLATFPDRYAYMLLELVAALLLIGRINYESREHVWTAVGLRQATGVEGRAFRSSLAVAIALVLLAWLAPSALASHPISEALGHSTRPWEQAQTEFNRLFGGLQAQNQDSLSGFGRAMTLHGSFHLTDTPVLDVVSARPEYWRAIVFDQYTGRGWLSSDPVDQATLPTGATLLKPDDQERADLIQQVTVLEPRGNYLVGASQPYRYDRPINAQAYHADAGSQIDLIATLSTKAIVARSQYTVVSSVSTASVAELRAAGSAYPAEVRERYLPLPTVPDRLRELAQNLTAGQSNPYDKAEAVETYLRSMPYSLDLPPPPTGRDGVDYFLFDAKTGYCDYFASAMAVLLRTQGVPARVVSGYATGEAQSDGSFLVKDSDSHTWVEAYFPSYGWVPFEPSGSWPRFARGEGRPAAATPTPVPAQVPPQSVLSQSQTQSQATPTPTPSPTPNAVAQVPPKAPARPPLNLKPLLPFLYLLSFLAALAGLAWYLWERDLRGLPPTVVAYAKMTRLAGLLGFGPRRGETPDEYGRALATALPEAGTSPSRIAVDYARFRFSRGPASDDDRPLRQWRYVRNALLRKVGRLRRLGPGAG